MARAPGRGRKLVWFLLYWALGVSAAGLLSLIIRFALIRC